MGMASPAADAASNRIERRSKLARRSGQDRRQNFDPNYKGPIRRITLDRRMRTSDRRKVAA